jgi:UrcA family protein
MQYNKLISACAAVAITAGSFGLVSPPAFAKSQRVVVVADSNIVTRRISYADLNLASSPGEATLNRRVGGAIRSLCLEATEGSDRFGVDHQCRNSAWGQARPQIDQATQRARDIAATGTSTIVAAAITINLTK